MNLKNEIYEVVIALDSTYPVGSATNQTYNIILNPQNINNGDMYNALSITVKSFKHTTSILLIGDYHCYDIDCALLNDSLLTVLQNESICQIDIPKGCVVFHKHLDCFGSNFGIYQVSVGYVIHGEIEITMLDFDFNKKWSFSGRDIFASVTGKPSFKIRNETIELFDFQDNFYKLDFTGKLLN